MGFLNRVDPEPTTHRRLKGLMLARVLIVTLLLGASALIQMGPKSTVFITPTNSLYFLIALTYCLTIIYALALKKVRNLYRFAYGQIFFDTIFITVLIYLTGGIESLFPLAYILSIVSASLVLSKQGTYVIAAVSGILYGLCLTLEYYGLIHPFSLSGPYLYGSRDVLYRVFVYFLAFTVVAALVNHLGEELRIKGKELREKQLDYEKLEAFHQNIVQSLDSGLITIDRSGSISFLNRTARRILGIHQLTDGSVDLDTFLSSLTAGSPGEPVKSEDIFGREETTFRRLDDKIIHLGLSKSPLRDMHGAIVGSILIFQDITRIKEMEEQIRRADRMVSIGHMAAGLAHEIRNPLASLTGSIQVLREEMGQGDSNLNLMNIVLRESERLNRLVTDFLLFAQPPRTEFSPILLNQLLDETLHMVTNSPQFNGHVSLTKTFLYDARVLGDANQLRQVFWNLFLNAIQAVEGRGELSVKLGQEGDSVKLSISDTGRGIDTQVKEKIFEPFFTTKEAGTGLGLAIVHRIIETHGGEIRVESQLGRGTTFTLFLPEIRTS
jgi:two-component system sensor histidine kinase PilS (NtrC family)